MGLDQYVFRVRKPNLEDRAYTSEEISDMHLNRCFIQDAEKEKGLVEQLLPYTVTRDVVCHFLNTKQIIADYNLPSDSYVGYSGSDGIRMRGEDSEGNSISQFVSQEEIDKKYIVTEARPCYVWGANEEAYWRKNYDLSEWMVRNHSHPIENTGYYKLNKTLIKRLNSKFKSHVPEESATKESALFYWEWY